MPTYCYRRGRKTYEWTGPVARRPAFLRLPGGGRAVRDYSVEMKGVPPTKGWPLTCFASGVHPNQAGELREYLAKAGVPTEVTPGGDPVYRNAVHRRKALKARGMFDRSSFV